MKKKQRERERREEEKDMGGASKRTMTGPHRRRKSYDNKIRLIAIYT